MNKKEFTNKWISQRIGALQSPFDARNLKYMKLPTLEDTHETPDTFKGLDEFSPTNFRRDQGSVGTCVGWDWNYNYETQLELLCAHHSIQMQKTDGTVLGYVTHDMSAGWAYQQSRKYSIPPVPDHIEGSTNYGAVRAAEKMGICTEALVPTDTTAPFAKIIENVEMWAEADTHKVSSYHNIANDPESIKAAIYGLLHELPYEMPDGTHGKTPLMAAFPVYANFKDAYDDGIVPMPAGRLLGGHSSPIFGWDKIDNGKYWENFGSWGTDIGDDGKFWIPEEYPFYPNDWWQLKIAPTMEPPKPTCIWTVTNWITRFLNSFENNHRYYYGLEVT